MTNRIPDKELEAFIRNTGYLPGSRPIQDPRSTRPIAPTRATFTVDDLVLRGQEFYSQEKDENDKYIGVAVAIQEAREKTGGDGVIASMPYHLAGKATAEKSNYLWKNWFTVLTEEDAGIDRNGTLMPAGQGVVLVVHGGGILTPDRIRQAIREGLTPQNSARYTNTEFENFLNGALPSGDHIDLYTVDDVKQGRIPDPFGRYAVWMPAEMAKSRASGYHAKPDFVNTELVIARAGTLEHLDTYFDKAKDSSNIVGNWHRFAEIDFQVPQGRVLFLYCDDGGLVGGLNLNYCGRFVGVAPEAPGARKK